MAKRRFVSVLLILLVLTAIALASCVAVEVVGIAITEDSEYKTEYVIGEDLDISGIKLNVKRSDGKEYIVFATDVREDLRILNFSTSKVQDDLAVIIEYKGQTTSFTVDVKAADAAMRRYTVTFETGEGSDVESATVPEYGKVASPEAPVRDGYAFDGWYKEATYNNQFNFSTEIITADTTLYAKWSKLYYITFCVDGEEMVVKSVKEGATLTDVPVVPPVEGMTGKWDRTTFTNIRTDVTVNAIYSVQTFTVRFYYKQPDVSGLVLISSFENVPYGCDFASEYAEAIAAFDFPKELSNNTHFIGWDQSFDSVTSNLEINAVYATNKYDVTFDLQYTPEGADDSVYSTVEDITYNNPVSAPATDPVREGYEFGGWYRQPECTTEWKFNIDRVEKDTTLYAKWTKLFNVRFLVSADIVTDEPITESVIIGDTEYKVYATYHVRGGATVEKPVTPAVKGYTGRWDVADAALNAVTNDLDVFGEYTINEYTVIFYNYDHTQLKTEKVLYGGDATPPAADPVRNGYGFTGWNVDFTNVERDLEVTAEFEPNLYSIRVYDGNNPDNPNASRIVDNVRFDSYIILDTPVYSGYKFAGWYTDSAYVNEWKINEQVLDRYEVRDGVVLSLYAKWTRLYTVTFLNETETGATVPVAVFEVENGQIFDEASAPAIEEQPGKTGAWHIYSGGVTAADAYDWSLPVTGNINLIPKYTPIVFTVRFLFPDAVFATRDVEYGSTVTDIPVPAQPVNGRKFISWQVDVASYIITEDTDIRSNYEIAKYSATWKDAVGETITVTYIEHGSAAVFPSSLYDLPAQIGYTFTGWVVDGDKNMNVVTEDITLRPTFRINTYPVRFRNPLTNEVYPQTVYNGTGTTTEQYLEYYTFLPMNTIVSAPSEQGKDFVGWRIARGGTKLLLGYGIGDDGKSLWKLFAADAAEGTRVLDGALIVTLDGYYYAENTDSLESALISGDWIRLVSGLEEYNGSWRLVKEGAAPTEIAEGTVAFAGGLYYAVESELVFESEFTASRYEFVYHTGIFDGDEEIVETRVYTYGEIVYAPESEDKEGYVFLGWYTDETYSYEFAFGNPATAPAELYARWEIQTTTVGITYTLNGTGDAYIASGIDASDIPTDGVFVVANYYNGKPVTEIAADAFADNDSVRRIVLPSTILKIGPNAFRNAVKLEYIEIPEKVSVIPDNCFNGCISLATVKFPSNSTLTAIGNSAFMGCKLLDGAMTYSEGTSFPETLTTIGAGAFYNCASFTYVRIPASVIEIGDNAFAGCNFLRYAVFDRTIPCNLGADVFTRNDEAYSAFRIYVPNVTAYTASGAGANWLALASRLCSSANVDDSGNWTYESVAGKAVLQQYIGNETSVVVPTVITVGGGNMAVSGIADYVFGASVTEVTLPAGVTITAYTFSSATSLSNLILGASGISASSQDLYNAFATSATLNTLTLGAADLSLAEIFGGNAPVNLKILVLEFTGAMSDNAYANNPYITEVRIGASVGSVSAGAFRNDTALKAVYFQGGSVTSIGANAFNGCVSLMDFRYLGAEGLPTGITSVGSDAFTNTPWLNGHGDAFVIVGQGILYKYNGLGEAVVSLPDEVVTIAPYAFYADSAITVLIAGSGSQLVTVGEYAFAECASLEAVVIPAHVGNIGSYAFYNDAKLATVVAMPSSRPSLGVNAFTSGAILKVYSHGAYTNWIAGATAVQVTNIVIDEEAGYIYSDSSLGGLMLIKSIDNDGTIVVPEMIGHYNVTQIADYALLRSTTSLTVNSALKPIGSEDLGKAFSGVTKLVSLTIYYNGGAGGSVGIASSLKALVGANASLTEIRVDGNNSVEELFGSADALPANIVSVVITGFETGSSDNKIVDRFLYNATYVENIYVEVDSQLVPLENTNKDDADAGYVFIEAAVGAYAFRGTAWMNDYDGDFITVLGGNLIDYKGLGAVADIPEETVRVNGGAFATATDLAVVYIPASVVALGDNAFSGAVNVVKVFMAGSTAPVLGNSVFNVGGTLEIFIPVGSLASYQAQGWQSYNPKENGSIVNSVKEISEGVFEQIIFDTATRTLHFYRKYTENYDADGNIAAVTDYDGVTVKATINVNGTEYNIANIGANAFLHTVKTVGISLTSVFDKEKTFDNIHALDKLILYDVNGTAKQGEALWQVVRDKEVIEIEYDGSITLDELLGVPSVRPETLTGVTVSDGVTSTVKNLLVNWDLITSVTFPDSIEQVGPNSLENTAWYAGSGEFVILGGGLLYKYKGSSATVVIPASVKVINTGAFSTLVWNENAGDSGDWDTSSTLKVSRIRFEAGSKATEILDYAFAGCVSLNSITLPSSMRFIADNAFEGTAFKTENDMLIVSGDSVGATLVKYYGTSASVILPTEVKVISAGAFKNNKDLVSLNLSASGSLLTTICEEAFYGCVNLRSLTLPSSLVSIGRGAFHNTRWLADHINAGTDAEIQGVLYQKISSDNGYYLIESDVVSVTSGALEPVSFAIGDETFTCDPGIETVELAPGATVSADDMYGLLSTIGVYRFVSDGNRSLSSLIGGREPLTNITSLGFSDYATEITDNYAYGWSGVTSVDPPSSISRIGNGAFVGTAWYDDRSEELVTLGGFVIKYNGAGGVVNIGNIYGSNIKGISADAFRGNTTITGIIFGEYVSNITEIPAEAFMGCTALTDIVLPETVTVYGENAFADTPWLASVADENGYVVLGGALIAYIGASSDIVIPAGTEKIYSYVFRGNEDITSVTFDRYCLMDTVDANTFRDCANLTSITLSEYIVNIDKTAFTGTAWINSNDILYYIDAYNGIKRAVLYVGNGGMVRIPYDVTEIAPNAFRGVTTITGIVFTENTRLTEIPAGAFEGCSSLSTVTLVSAIKTIGDNAFSGTPYLNALTAEFVVVGGKLVRYNGSASAVTLPAGITALDASAFSGKSDIVSVDMSATSITEIPAGAFSGMTSLTTVIFAPSTVYVGSGAFTGTGYLAAFEASDDDLLIAAAGDGALLIAAKSGPASAVIPENVSYIPTHVFKGNTHLTEITFTAPVTVETGAFNGCAFLQTVNGIEYVDVSGDIFAGTLYANGVTSESGMTVINGVLSAYSGKGGEVVIPAGVSRIAAGVFTGNASITSLSFENIDAELSIDAEAFRNCVNLAEITFSDKIRSVGYRAFYNTAWADGYGQALLVVNGKLLAYLEEGTSIRITNDVNSFAENVFTGNKNIVSLTFDARTSLITIPAEAFMNCTSLNTVTFPGTNIEIGKDAFLGTNWYTRQTSSYIAVNGKLIGYKGTSPEITIPANVTYIYDYVFVGNTNIVSLAFATGTRIESITGKAFAGCASLATVTLPASLNYLEIAAFEGTPWLAAQGEMIVVGTKLVAYRGAGGDIVIPTTVQSIGGGVFSGNTSITSVSFALGSYVRSIPAGAFAGCTSLTSFTFPEGIETVGQGAFEGTPWYDALSNDNGLTDGAYIYNGRLLFYKGTATEYTIPSGVRVIADYAFSGTTVSAVTLTSTDPGAINPGSALSAMQAIYVPAANLAQYRQHSYWQRYYTLLKAAPVQQDIAA